MFYAYTCTVFIYVLNILFVFNVSSDAISATMFEDHIIFLTVFNHSLIARSFPTLSVSFFMLLPTLKLFGVSP